MVALDGHDSGREKLAEGLEFSVIVCQSFGWSEMLFTRLARPSDCRHTTTRLQVLELSWRKTYKRSFRLVWVGDAVGTSSFSPDIHGKDCPMYCGVLYDWGWTLASRPRT